jgi:hypothetical protein
VTERDRISTALLTLRLGVFTVMVLWTLDKFIHPEHAAGVSQNFYGVPGLGGGRWTIVAAKCCNATRPTATHGASG